MPNIEFDHCGNFSDRTNVAIGQPVACMEPEPALNDLLGRDAKLLKLVPLRIDLVSPRGFGVGPRVQFDRIGCHAGSDLDLGVVGVENTAM